MAGSGRLKKTLSSVVVCDKETGVEDSDEDGSESGSSGMGGRRLAGGPEGGSEGGVSRVAVGRVIGHSREESNFGRAGESNDATM